MSHKFLMVFLTSEDGVDSIYYSARILQVDTNNDITEHGRYKSKYTYIYYYGSGREIQVKRNEGKKATVLYTYNY